MYLYIHTYWLHAGVKPLSSGVATVSGLLKIMGLFSRMSSLV